MQNTDFIPFIQVPVAQGSGILLFGGLLPQRKKLSD